MRIGGWGLGRFGQTRRTLKALERIALAQEGIHQTLRRVADRVAPEEPIPAEEQIKSAGVSFSRDEELARIEDYVAKCWQEVHRAPTEEEIVRYLDGEEVKL